ncbi:MAG: DUF4190 domain-containing protein [Chthoniobacterales bacterium]|nr:DUF4190 domain-containing protein [Chthoniobacterales bacterium]
METFIIGRQSSSGGVDIAVPPAEDTVGRRHAELQVRPDESCTIRDLGSANGTFVQEGGRWSRISTANVGAHQNIRLGDYVTTPSQLMALRAGGRAFHAGYQPTGPQPKSDPLPVYQAKTYDPHQAAYAPQAYAVSASEPLAVWSFVLGLLALLCTCGITAIPAVICGHVALSKIGNPARKQGRGLAIAGLVLGYIGILWFCLCGVWLIFFGGWAFLLVLLGLAAASA